MKRQKEKRGTKKIKSYGPVMGKSNGKGDPKYPLCSGNDCWCYDCCIDRASIPYKSESFQNIDEKLISEATLMSKIKLRLFRGVDDIEHLTIEIQDLKTQIKEERERRKIQFSSLGNHIKKISLDYAPFNTLQAYLRFGQIFHRSSYNDFDHMSHFVFRLNENIKDYHFDETFFTFQPYIDATNEKEINNTQFEIQKYGLQHWYEKNTYHGHKAWLIIIAGPRLPFDIVIQWVLKNKV